MSAEQARTSFFDKAKYSPLTVTPNHCCAVEQLPRLTADPFDRMLVAQAVFEPMRLLTHDSDLAAYGDTVICI